MRMELSIGRSRYTDDLKAVIGLVIDIVCTRDFNVLDSKDASRQGAEKKRKDGSARQ